MKKILAIGHSHLNALRLASTVDKSFDFFPFIDDLKEGKYVEKNPSDFRRFANADYASVALLVKGSRHIVLGLVNHPVSPFDFYLPEQPDLPINANAELLPVGLVENILKRYMMSELHFVAELASIFNTQIYQIDVPPPLPTRYIEQFPAGFAEQIKMHGVSPDAFRYKLWRLHSKILRENCTKAGISFVEVPEQSKDQHGCLAESYWRNDLAHANALYGDLVLNQLRVLNGMDIR